jgi:hypothetical protein
MTLTERGLGQRRPDVQERAITVLILRTIDGMEVRGSAHLPRGTRPIDFLNRDAEQFIAITDAVIYFGGQTDKTAFVAVNKNHIVSLRES